MGVGHYADRHGLTEARWPPGHQSWHAAWVVRAGQKRQGGAYGFPGSNVSEAESALRAFRPRRSVVASPAASTDRAETLDARDRAIRGEPHSELSDACFLVGLHALETFAGSSRHRVVSGHAVGKDGLVPLAIVQPAHYPRELRGVDAVVIAQRRLRRRRGLASAPERRKHRAHQVPGEPTRLVPVDFDCAWRVLDDLGRP